MRALIVEDERIARRELRRLLEAHPEVAVVGEAATVTEALERIEALDPDLLFLDIEMPGGTGFDLLERLDAVPAVIFTTAYDEHALRAFEVSALDYLLKPIEATRLARAIERAGAAGAVRAPGGVESSAGDSAGDAAAAAADPSGRPLGAGDRVFVKDGDRCWFVELGSVRLFESVGNYARIHFGAEKPLIGRSLNQLETRLDPDVFFRANRHQIVNVNRIEAIEPWFNGALALRVEGGHEVVMSRRRAGRFREIRGI